MRARFLLVGVALVFGCSPKLKGDGFYRCNEGQCPSTAPFCHPDHVCRTTPVGASDDAGMHDAGSRDAGPHAMVDASLVDFDAGPTAYPACDMALGASGCAVGTVCIGDVTMSGYCSGTCSSSADCPDSEGAHSACGPDGHCRRGCRVGVATCTAPLSCVLGDWGVGTGATTACAESALISPPEYGHTCSSSAMCDKPSECIHGACLRPCTSAGTGSTTGCLATEVCAATPAGTTGAPLACLPPCGPAGPTCPGAFSFCDGTHMPSRCAPAGW